MWPFRKDERKELDEMLDRALATLPLHPARWAEDVYEDPTKLHQVHTAFLQLKGNVAWQFFRSMMVRKIEKLTRDLRRAPAPGERDRTNEIRAVITTLESLLTVPEEIEQAVEGSLRAASLWGGNSNRSRGET